jgi:hypothetical protein
VDTGFPESDAVAAFARERRRQALAKLASRLTMKREDALAMLPFDDVVAALGLVAEHDLGLQAIALEAIVGTVNRRNGGFERLFRPRSRRLQSRWQRIAAARRRGETTPPIDVYRIDELHFIQDGHHRVQWRALTATKQSTPASGRYIRHGQLRRSLRANTGAAVSASSTRLPVLVPSSSPLETTASEHRQQPVLRPAALLLSDHGGKLPSSQRPDPIPLMSGSMAPPDGRSSMDALEPDLAVDPLERLRSLTAAVEEPESGRPQGEGLADGGGCA